MKVRYEGDVFCSTAEKSLYSPVYDDILEKRLSGSAGSRTHRHPGRNIESRGRSRSGRVRLSGTARSWYRKKLLILLAAAVILTFVFGAIGVHAIPKDAACSDEELAYKVITVERGDTLWDIAQTCYRTTDDDIRTYIDKIRRMNHIHGDNLKEGQLLLIYYGDPDSGDIMEVAEN